MRRSADVRVGCNVNRKPNAKEVVIMVQRNRNKRVRVGLVGLAVCLMLATAAGIVLSSGIALAKKPPKPPAPQDPVVFSVELTSCGLEFEAPTYLPACSAETLGTANEKFWARFPRHDLAATVEMDTGYLLTDDISIEVNTDKAGNIVSFQLFGQDVIGEEGLMHQSEVVEIYPPVVPSDEGFTLHVDVDWLPIWKTADHLKKRRPKLVEIVGYISVSDMVYTPVAP
jgi:hypothetical protein